MKTTTSRREGVEIAFVSHLRRLEADRGAMAALRRSLDASAAGRARVHRYVVPFLAENPDQRTDHAMYLVAGLFGLHPSPGASDNESLGGAFRRLDKDRERDGKPKESVERRFTTLLSTDAEDIAYALRQAVTLLKAGDIPVCWDRLLRDIMFWHRDDGWVQQRWARDFWGDDRPAKDNPEGAHNVS